MWKDHPKSIYVYIQQNHPKNVQNISRSKIYEDSAIVWASHGCFITQNIAPSSRRRSNSFEYNQVWRCMKSIPIPSCQIRLARPSGLSGSQTWIVVWHGAYGHVFSQLRKQPLVMRPAPGQKPPRREELTLHDSAQACPIVRSKTTKITTHLDNNTWAASI